MGGHTKEPWETQYVHGAATPTILILKDGYQVCRLRGAEVANARRICLAVNACASLSDAALESDVIAVVREALEFYTQEKVTEFEPVQQSHTHVVERPDGSRTLGFITINRGEKARAALALLATDKGE